MGTQPKIVEQVIYLCVDSSDDIIICNAPLPDHKPVNKNFSFKPNHVWIEAWTPSRERVLIVASGIAGNIIEVEGLYDYETYQALPYKKLPRASLILISERLVSSMFSYKYIRGMFNAAIQKVMSAFGIEEYDLPMVPPWNDPAKGLTWDDKPQVD